MPDTKGLAHLRINAAGYGLNGLFDVEDDTARAAAQSNHDAIIDLAQQVAGDEADIAALQAKDAEIDATILQIDARDDDQDTQLNALQNKTQLYSVVGGVNVNHPVLKIGDGLEVNNNVLNVTGGGGGGGDISALTARVEALEDNDEVQDGEISALQTNVNTLSTVQTSQGNAITALQSSDASQNSDIADIKAALQSADLANMASRLTSVEAKNAQQDTDIDNLQTDMTTAQGDISGLKTRMTTAESDINALETNDGVQDTDIDNLQTAMTTAQGDISGLKTRMTTAENDIDALEANDLRFSIEKTGLYTSSGGTNTYYTDLALGSGLAVTNGVLDTTGGGGGFSQCTTIANANDATTPGLYCPASSSSTNFPGNRTNYNDGTLIVTSYAASGDGNIVQQMYIENPKTISHTSAANPKIWTRVKYQSEDWFTPGTFTYTWTKWNMVAQGASLASSPNSAADGISVIWTNSAGSDYPAELLNGNVYGVIITTTSPNAATESFQAGQVLVTWESNEAKVFIRLKYSGTWSAWAKVAGGGSTGPTKIAAGTDLDTITTEGEYYFNGGYMTNMPTWPGMVAPSRGEGNTPYFMTVRKRPYGGDSGSTYLIEQEIMATDNAVSGFITSAKNTIRHISRVQINGGSWSSWVSQDTAMTCTDCNLACRTGKYWINSNSNNRPSGMGTGVTGVMDVTYEYGDSTNYTVIQKITTASAIYVRNNTSSATSQQGTWNAWKSITLS